MRARRVGPDSHRFTTGPLTTPARGWSSRRDSIPAAQPGSGIVSSSMMQAMGSDVSRKKRRMALVLPGVGSSRRCIGMGGRASAMKRSITAGGARLGGVLAGGGRARGRAAGWGGGPSQLGPRGGGEAAGEGVQEPACLLAEGGGGVGIRVAVEDGEVVADAAGEMGAGREI